MIKKIKQFILAVRENIKLKVEAEVLKNKVGDSRYVVEKIMKRGIGWYDYNLLKPNEMKEYYADAQSALRNKTLINELNHIVADAVEYISRDSKNFDDVEKIRMTINAVDLIKQRLEGISDPNKSVSKNNIHEAI